MYFLLIGRVVKHNTGSKEAYAPRTANEESLRISGPFSKRTTAERAMVSVLATHTCLSVKVVTLEYLQKLDSDSQTPYGAAKEVKRMLIALACEH